VKIPTTPIATHVPQENKLLWCTMIALAFASTPRTQTPSPFGATRAWMIATV
jgi:hypothetical protein